ncbi:hypothetical protein AB4Z50_26695 [Paenibacillus sp. 2TAB26]|uniref:hypothetical protein n=1 Tax=Paenibacillus sp. 2TAB26 TaxID=3233005 RepID=UPI003F9A9808
MRNRWSMHYCAARIELLSRKAIGETLGEDLEQAERYGTKSSPIDHRFLIHSLEEACGVD